MLFEPVVTLKIIDLAIIACLCMIALGICILVKGLRDLKECQRLEIEVDDLEKELSVALSHEVRQINSGH